MDPETTVVISRDRWLRSSARGDFHDKRSGSDGHGASATNQRPPGAPLRRNGAPIGTFKSCWSYCSKLPA
jgi:hypothetical protein